MFPREFAAKQAFPAVDNLPISSPRKHEWTWLSNRITWPCKYGLFLTIFQFLCHINFLSLLSELFTSLCTVKMLPFQTVWVGEETVIYFNVMSLAWACKETEPVTKIKSLTVKAKRGIPCRQHHICFRHILHIVGSISGKIDNRHRSAPTILSPIWHRCHTSILTII